MNSIRRLRAEHGRSGCGFIVAGLAAAAFATALGSGSPAFAGRPPVADVPTGGGAITGCTLGTVCAGNPVLNLFDPFHFGFGRPQYDAGGVFKGYVANIYIYQEGVVSFGDPLPLTASLAGGTASLGDGDWFAPAFGTALTTMALYNSGIGNEWVNWDDAAGNILFQMEIHKFGTDPTWHSRDPSLDPYAIEFWGPGRPGGDLEAFHYNATSIFSNTDGLYSDAFTCAHGGGPLGCPGSSNADLPGSGTPEPMTWALLVSGFAGIGAVLRNRRRMEA